MIVIAVARIASDAIDEFIVYEREVLALLADHGGALEQRYRSDDGTTEVHVVRFPSREAFEAYRSDPRRPPSPPAGVSFNVYELDAAPVSDLL